MYKTSLIFICMLLSFSLNAANFVMNSFDEPRQVLFGPQGQQFHVFEVVGDGDCGFHILGTREEIYNYVMNNAEDNTILTILTPEAKDWYAHKAYTDPSKVEIDTALNETNILTPEQLIDFMFNRYFVAYPTEIIPSDKYLACLEESSYEISTPTGLIDVVARLKQLNINVWRESDIGLIPMRQILIDPDLRTIDLFFSGGHFKRLVTQDFYGNTIHDRQNLKEALETEERWYELYLQNEVKSFSEQAEIIKLIEIEDDLYNKILISQTKQMEGLPVDFDPLSYIQLYKDLQLETEKITSNEKKIEWAKNHYLNNGKKEGRKYIEGLPADFNPLSYIQLYKDLQLATEKITSNEQKIEWAKKHYLNNGKKEGRKYIEGLPADFYPLVYLRMYPDLQRAIENMTSDEQKIEWAKNHYLINGKKEGRKY
ncbi:MAG: hypothetical protein Q8L85_01840 [Alphaproteobacteria bacterium]|nr:hypothetical protein [Alphaproteobacteria bacterium]